MAKQITDAELIKRAKKVAKRKVISKYFNIISGEVGCALVTDKGNVYLGVSIEACCGMGFCAEPGAIAAMVTNREYRIKRIVAVSSGGAVLPPCGRCREFMYEINEKNLDADVIIGKNKTVKLRELLPHTWQKCFKASK